MLMSFRNLVLYPPPFALPQLLQPNRKRWMCPSALWRKTMLIKRDPTRSQSTGRESVVTLREIGKSSQPVMWIMVPGANGSDPKVSLTFDVSWTGPCAANDPV